MAQADCLGHFRIYGRGARTRTGDLLLPKQVCYQSASSPLLEIELMEILGWPREDEYRWLVCGDRVISRPETERHVPNHHVAADAAERVVRRRYPPRSVDQAKESEGRTRSAEGIGRRQRRDLAILALSRWQVSRTYLTAITFPPRQRVTFARSAKISEHISVRDCVHPPTGTGHICTPRARTRGAMA